MFARVTTFQIRPDKIDENNQVAESIIPAIKQQTGFKTFFALQDRSSGKAILVTIFETEADMKAGVTHPEKLQWVEDRRRAISQALDSARPGDAILIAGKGHEAYQEFADTVIPFDDRQVARELIGIKKLRES